MAKSSDAAVNAPRQSVALESLYVAQSLFEACIEPTPLDDLPQRPPVPRQMWPDLHQLCRCGTMYASML